MQLILSGRRTLDAVPDFGHTSPLPCSHIGDYPVPTQGGDRHVYESDIADAVTPKTASDVKELLAGAMALVRAGKMDPKLGTTLGDLGTSLLKAIETSDIELRLARLEASSELKDEN